MNNEVKRREDGTEREIEIERESEEIEKRKIRLIVKGESEIGRGKRD